MKPVEWANYHTSWHPLVVTFARRITQMLEDTRKMATALFKREQSVKTREAELTSMFADSERNIADQRVSLATERASMLAEIQKSRAKLAAVEAAAELRTQEAAELERAAVEKIKEADDTRRYDVLWKQALEVIAMNPAIIVVGTDGVASLDPNVAKTLSEDFAKTMASPVPDWADRALSNQLTLAERVHATQLRETESAANVAELRDLIEKANAILIPSQQVVVSQAKQALRRIGQGQIFSQDGGI